MIFLKIIYHLNSAMKKMFYKLIFNKKVKFGKGSNFRKRFNIMLEGKGNISIGKSCFFNNDCSINSLDYISIGDNTIFGENVRLYDHNHRFSNINESIMNQGYNTAPIKIGHDCWIGSNVVILKGVTIGDNVIVGAGCIIKEDIPNNMIVRGDIKLNLVERRA